MKGLKHATLRACVPDASGRIELTGDQLTEQFKTVIAAGGGKVGKTEYWGLRSLTFRIKKNRKAHYTLLNIDAPPAAVAEMERQMSINEDVIRFMTVRVDELEDGALRHDEGRHDARRERGGGRGFGGRGGRGFDDDGLLARQGG